MPGESKPAGPQAAAGLEKVYRNRFPESTAAGKAEIWEPIVAYLQRFIEPDGVVLEIACDRGDFIRRVRARERWATDIRDVGGALPADVRFLQADGLSLDGRLPNRHFDAIFMSNYLEHLPSQEAVLKQLAVCATLLKTGGRLVILQPNIRLVGGRYWDFIDHKVALTERSLVEAATVAGFETRKLITRFLPYTTTSRLPQAKAVVQLYLRLPIAWLVMGKQTLYVGALAAPED